MLQSISHLLARCCTLCGQYHEGTGAICHLCHEFFVPIGDCCQYCALPLPSGNFLTCGQCIQNKPYFDETLAPYAFEEPLRTLLHEFKYRSGLYLRSFLAQLILNHLSADRLNTECLIPVPIHSNKLRERGFNQAAELTKCLSKTLSIPYHLTLCEKQRQTPSQAGLNASLRQKNLVNAFKVKIFTL